MNDLARVRAAKEHLRDQLAGCDGVVGLGIAEAESGYCLKVNVVRDEVVEQVPDSVDGVEVRTFVIGPISSQI